VVDSPLTWIETRRWMAAEIKRLETGRLEIEGLAMGEIVARLMAVAAEGIEWLLAIEAAVDVAQVS